MIFGIIIEIMFELLCKAFIKDHENIEDEKVRERYGTFFSVFSIFCNILMVIFKLIVSFEATRSPSVPMP